MNGRKRHILVDSTGLLIKAVVHSAEITDRNRAFLVLGAIVGICRRLKLIRADMGYRGEELKNWIEQVCQWKLEIVKRPRKWGSLSGECRTATDAGVPGLAAPRGG